MLSKHWYSTVHIFVLHADIVHRCSSFCSLMPKQSSKFANKVVTKIRVIFFSHLIVINVLCTDIIGLKSLVIPSVPFEKSLAFHGMAELFQSRSANSDETVNSFFQRRFGHEVQIFFRFFTARALLSVCVCLSVDYHKSEFY